MTHNGGEGKVSVRVRIRVREGASMEEGSTV